MCTTSVECRTIMTVMLTVMSGMDPHMIRVTWIGMVWMVEWLISLLLGQTTEVDSVVGSMSHLKEKSL
jgi:low temperature requirement protein LtrA